MNLDHRIILILGVIPRLWIIKIGWKENWIWEWQKRSSVRIHFSRVMFLLFRYDLLHSLFSKYPSLILNFSDELKSYERRINILEEELTKYKQSSRKGSRTFLKPVLSSLPSLPTCCGKPNKSDHPKTQNMWHGHQTWPFVLPHLCLPLTCHIPPHPFQFGQCVHPCCYPIVNFWRWYPISHWSVKFRNRSSLRSELCELDLSSSFNHYRHRFFVLFASNKPNTRANRETLFRMITPVFKVTQTNDLIIIEITAKYSKENV